MQTLSDKSGYATASKSHFIDWLTKRSSAVYMGSKFVLLILKKE